MRSIEERLALPDPWAGIHEAAVELEPARARLAALLA
jgi:hypothetical protein